MKNPPYHDIMKYMYIRTTHYNIKRTSSKLEKKGKHLTRYLYET